MSALEQVYRGALALPALDREELVQLLLASLRGAEREALELPQAWENEVAQRIARLDAGLESVVDWATARARIERGA